MARRLHFSSWISTRTRVLLLAHGAAGIHVVCVFGCACVRGSLSLGLCPLSFAVAHVVHGCALSEQSGAASERDQTPLARDIPPQIGRFTHGSCGDESVSRAVHVSALFTSTFSGKHCSKIVDFDELSHCLLFVVAELHMCWFDVDNCQEPLCGVRCRCELRSFAGRWSMRRL